MAKVFILASYARSLKAFRGPLIEEFLARGHIVHACAPDLNNDVQTRDWLKVRGVFCHDASLSRAGLNPLQDLAALAGIARIVRLVRPDVFLGYTIKPVVWGLLATFFVRVPRRVALITGLGYAFTGEVTGKRAVIQSLARFLYTVALRVAHLVIFQNRDDRVDFERYGILPGGACVEVVNGSGVDLTFFLPRSLPKGPPEFLLIARLLGDKGIREYAEAAAALSRDWPSARFHLVGGLDPNPDGIEEAEVKEWVRSGTIIWHGAVEDVRPVLAACHVYVLPSYREGTPRTVLEAMATGRPVITTDAPGCRETVVDGVNGFLVPVRDSKSLALAMSKFLEQPELIGRMGAASREIVQGKFDVRLVNQRMLAAMKL